MIRVRQLKRSVKVREKSSVQLIKGEHELQVCAMMWSNTILPSNEDWLSSNMDVITDTGLHNIIPFVNLNVTTSH